MLRPLALAAVVLSASASHAAVPSDWKQLVALATSRGECITEADTRSEQYAHQLPGCTLKLDEGDRTGYVRVAGEASAPDAVLITLWNPAFTVGTGALSGQTHVARSAVSLILEMDGTVVNAYRIDPSESECPSCSSSEYLVFRDGSTGPAVNVTVWDKKTELSGAQLDSELASAVNLWRMSVLR